MQLYSLKALDANSTAPEDIISYVDSFGIAIVYGGRVQVRKLLKEADELSNSPDQVYRITYNHSDTELGYPHSHQKFTSDFALKLAQLAYKRADLKKVHCLSELPKETIDEEQQKIFHSLVTQITDLEKVEGIGNQIPAWEIWDQLSDLCDGINTDGRARYKNIAKSNFQLGHNFLLSWLVQLLTSQVRVLKDS